MVSWDVLPCVFVYRYQYFGGTCYFRAGKCVTHHPEDGGGGFYPKQ
jgi:hypothetical protein